MQFLKCKGCFLNRISDAATMKEDMVVVDMLVDISEIKAVVDGGTTGYSFIFIKNSDSLLAIKMTVQELAKKLDSQLDSILVNVVE